MNKEISIIIVNYNVYNDIVTCIKSIYEHTNDIKFEIIVVDNNSPDRSILAINTIFPDIKLLALDTNNGFGVANNEAMKIAKGKYFLLINPDIVFSGNTVEVLYNYLEKNENVGATGPVQLKPNEGIEYYYSFFPTMYSRAAQEFGLYEKAPLIKKRRMDFWDENVRELVPFKVDWIIGSCILIRRMIYDSIGGFNEAFFLYEEEVEWQYRMNKAGWRSVILPECKVLHNHHSSTSKLGVMFILYHEFRSRIIFSSIQYDFPLIILRKILMLAAVNFRMWYFTITQFRSYRISVNRFHLYFDLVKLILSTRKAIMKSRFKFYKYIHYFEDNRNAKL